MFQAVIKIEDYEVDYTQYYYKPQKQKFNRNPKKHRKHGKLKFIVILIMLAIAIFIVIKIGGINNIKSQTSRTENSLITEDYTYYFVTSESILDNASATALSKKIKYRGCAGYVEEVAGRYNVLFNIYLTNSDATSVASKLAQYGYNLTVVKKTVKSKKIFFDSPNNAINHNLEIIENLNTLVKAFYELALNLDSSTEDLAAGKSELKAIMEDCETRLLEYQSVVGNSESCVPIVNAYMKIISESRVAYESNLDVAKFSAEIKVLSITSFFSLDSIVNKK